MKANISDLALQIRSGDRRALAKGITLIESALPEKQKMARELLNILATNPSSSKRIGISGSPGVGKSTFIESYGMHLIGLGKKIAVLAIDPSSPVSGGSILGDKTRMEQLSAHPNAFIRPSAAGNYGGGVARYTRESIYLCEAAGFDTIIIETVGVGQSDFIVSSMVDLFVILQLPNAGDELQGIKKGILELADMIIVTKVDGEFLKTGRLTQLQHQNALRLVKDKTDWLPPVILCSSIEKSGFTDIDLNISHFFDHQSQQHLFMKKREVQALQWLDQELSIQIKEKLLTHPRFQTLYNQQKIAVQTFQMPASRAAQEIIDLLFSSQKEQSAKPVS